MLSNKALNKKKFLRSLLDQQGEEKEIMYKPSCDSITNSVDSPTSYMSVRLRFICWSFKSELLNVIAPDPYSLKR